MKKLSESSTDWLSKRVKELEGSDLQKIVARELLNKKDEVSMPVDTEAINMALKYASIEELLEMTDSSNACFACLVYEEIRYRLKTTKNNKYMSNDIKLKKKERIKSKKKVYGGKKYEY